MIAQILLDEIGRGTAPNDGVAISYAAAKHLLNRRSRTIFATHLHIVCDLLWKDRQKEPIDFKQTSVDVNEEVRSRSFLIPAQES
jgi:DNA mismatch repair ATPase MutS